MCHVQGELVRMATELETSLLAKTGREGAASPVVAASDDLQVWQTPLHARNECQPHVYDQQLLACSDAVGCVTSAATRAMSSVAGQTCWSED